MIYLTCDRWIDLEAGTRCQLVDGHDGDCREITWAELQSMDDEGQDNG
jgi:hypothetical protein